MSAPSFGFGGVAAAFTVRFDLDQLSPRDRCHLFNALAEKLGLNEASHERPEESYQVLWKEAMDRNWGPTR